MRLSALLALSLVGVLFRTPHLAAAQPEPTVTVTAVPDRPTARPGDQIVVAVILDHALDWHTHTNSPQIPASWGDFEAIPTVITVQSAVGGTVGPIQWPVPHEISLDLAGSGTPEPYGVFSDRAVAYVPILISEDASDNATFSLRVSFQACDDRVCLRPERVDIPVSITIDPAAASGPPDPALFKAFDARVFAAMNAGIAPPPPAPAGPSTSAPEALSVLGFTFDPDGVVGLVLVLVVSAVGGFLLNFTPCVLPVIPLKILGLAQAAGSPRRTFFLGTMMAVGLLGFWLGIGVLVVAVKAIPSVSGIFANPWFNLGLGGFIVVMALGMVGAFTLRLPQAVYAFNPGHDTAFGSVLFGAMTGVFGLPCFGTFAGATVGWSLKQPVIVGLGVFGAIGAGMAIPYLILSARPTLVNRLPRTGPASDLIKQVMGLLLLAAAAFFVGTGLLSLLAQRPYLSTVLYWWAVAIFCVLAGGWLLLRTFQITPSWPRRTVFGTIGAGIGALAVWVAIYFTGIAERSYTPVDATGRSTGLWQPYAPDVFERSLADGKVVVVNFTAEWCLNCKTLEAVVLSREDVKAALSAEGVVALKADLTSDKAPGWKLLSDLGEVGIPLLSIHGPGFERPFKSNAYGAATVIEQVAAARGTARPDNSPAGTAGAVVPTGFDSASDRP